MAKGAFHKYFPQSNNVSLQCPAVQLSRIDLRKRQQSIAKFLASVAPFFAIAAPEPCMQRFLGGATSAVSFLRIFHKTGLQIQAASYSSEIKMVDERTVPRQTASRAGVV